MTTFPIANMIRQGIPLRAPFGLGQDLIGHNAAWSNVLDGAVYFDVSIPSTLYWQGRQDLYSLQDDFGPLRTPYPLMWMEWAIPNRYQIEGRWNADIHDAPAAMCAGQRWAAILHTTEGNTRDLTTDTVKANFEDFVESNPDQFRLEAMPTDADYTDLTAMLRRRRQDVINVEVTLLFTAPDGMVTDRHGSRAPGVVALPVRKGIMIDPATGHYLQHSCIDFVPKEAMKADPQKIRLLTKVMSDCNVVWLSLQLLNCRNVTTRQTGSVFTRSGADKRRGEPTVKYHTIVLPGTAAPTHGRRQRSHDVMALHKVRGHFKTFTADRPLLGKHIGTYWWGWQMRGTADNGAVVSDYRVDA